MPDTTTASQPAVPPLTAAERAAVYAARRFIGTSAEKKLDILIPFDESCFVAWEPGLGDGPTSARFAVVDYDAHTEVLAPPAQWGRRSALLVEPGKRVQNVRNYEDELGDGAGDLPGYQELEKAWLDAPQPWRTDCEHARSGAEFADVEIEPH